MIQQNQQTWSTSQLTTVPSSTLRCHCEHQSSFQIHHRTGYWPAPVLCGWVHCLSSGSVSCLVLWAVSSNSLMLLLFIMNDWLPARRRLMNHWEPTNQSWSHSALCSVPHATRTAAGPVLYCLCVCVCVCVGVLCIWMYQDVAFRCLNLVHIWYWIYFLEICFFHLPISDTHL